MDKNIHVPISREDAEGLRAGDYVYLTGTIYTARDAAHKRMKETLDAGKELPLSLDRNVIYYMGPSPPPCWVLPAGISAYMLPLPTANRG